MSKTIGLMRKFLGSAAMILAVGSFLGCGQGEAEQPWAEGVVVGPPVTVFGEDKTFAQSHASTLIRLDDGQFLVAAFGGTAEKDDDVGIWMTRGDGQSWSTPIEVAKVREDPHWNPVLFEDPAGTIHLYFKVGKTIPKWETWVMTSGDGGHTWTEARELVEGDQGGRGPVRNKPIVLSNGDLLAGASHEEGQWDAFADWSQDGGQTWNRTAYLVLDREELTGKGVIQPTLWESASGTVHMLLRSTAGAIYRSDSDDFGRNWSPAYRTDLPNPNSAIDLVQLEDGTLALLYNPDGENWGSRATLTLAFSFDNGQTWPEQVVVGQSELEDGELSYPAIIQWGDQLALTYTWERKDIVFQQVTIPKRK